MVDPLKRVLSLAALSVLLVVPCGAQAPLQTPASPSIQNQLGQTSQAALPPVTSGAGVSTDGPTAVPVLGVGSSASSSLGKRFGSAGRGLSGMPGGPPLKGGIGSQDPSGKYMRPSVIPPLFCDPALNIPC